MLRELKYLSAYSIPLAAVLGLALGGAFTWLTPLYAFGLIPLLEALTGEDPLNDQPPTAAARRTYDWLLYLNVPLQYGILLTTLWQLTHGALAGWEMAGLVLSAGICSGVLGINVAHELGHRPTAGEQTAAHALLLSTLFLHFFVEHNRGHHRYVGTHRDSATARRGENFYAFLLRAVPGEWRSAWHLEAERLGRQKQSAWSWQNALVRYAVAEIVFVLSVGLVFGAAGAAALVLISAVGIFLLQIVDYVEHYGLLRQEVSPGIYERVRPCHSWNSDFVLGRVMLYELTRHSDHHYQPARKYQTLRHVEPSPQLPAGYPTMMLLALVPPFWFRVMDNRAEAALSLIAG